MCASKNSSKHGERGRRREGRGGEGGGGEEEEEEKAEKREGDNMRLHDLVLAISCFCGLAPTDTALDCQALEATIRGTEKW